jgi:Family of unknown function (DUF6445)
MNLYPVTIVENFYENPDAIRKFALAQKFTFCKELPNIEYVYPGCRTKDLSLLNKDLFDKICTKLVSIFHNTEHDYMRWLITTSFQSVTEEYNQGVIHTDHNTIFAAVLYLTPNAPLDSGTSLFKKNKNFNEAKYQRALEENDERFKAGEIAMDTSYHSMFDEIVRVNNVYNTLILYEGRHFHAANQFFGKTLKDSRLAQVFFINKIDAQKQSVFPISRVNAIKV